MLGKLLKYEFRSTWKVQVFLLGAMPIITVLCGLGFWFPIWETDWTGLTFTAVMLGMLFYFAVIGIGLGSCIYLAVRYYKSMYTDEGYLTNTLPVTARQLMLAKTISMSVWRICVTVVTLCSILLFFGMIITGGRVGTAFLGELDLDMRFFRENDMGWTGYSTLMFILTVVVTGFSSSIAVMAAAAIGQLVQGHRVLGAVGAYFGITSAVSFVSTVCTMPVMFRFMKTADFNRMNVFAVYTPMFTIMTAVGLAAGIALYFVCEYMTGKKLDLE